MIGFTLLLVGSAALPSAVNAKRPAEAGSVLRADQPLTQYRAFRRMHARSDRFNHEGWLEAWTERDERGFRFEIVSERGSETIRNKVLRSMLKREQELVEDGEDRAALTEENYEFTEADPAPDGARLILMKPRRKDVLLLEGRMVMSPDGSALLRVEGRMSKNPSFWTSAVNVTRHYAVVDGVRVPVSTESVAKVKMAGESRLDVSYEYESINGRPVSLAGRRLLASAAGTAR